MPPAPACVFCGQTLRARIAQPGKMYCPSCDPPDPVSRAQPQPRPEVITARPALPAIKPLAPSIPPAAPVPMRAPEPAPAPNQRGLVLLGIFGGLFLLAGSAVGLAVYFANNNSNQGPPDSPAKDQRAGDGRTRDSYPSSDSNRPRDGEQPRDG